MKHNYLLLCYNNLNQKYRKFFLRLQRHINNGTFAGLSTARKKFLIQKVDELRNKLIELQPKLTGIIVSCVLLSGLNTTQTFAQSFVHSVSKSPIGEVTLVHHGSNYLNQSTTGDLDNDGDNDIIITSQLAEYYYKNVGTNSAASFSLVTGTNSPINTLTFSYHYNSAQLADIDGDGDLDLINSCRKVVQSNPSQLLIYYLNTGTISSPAFIEQTGTNNPFPQNISITNSCYPSLSIVDIDGDGDKDLFVLDGISGDVCFIKNTGTRTQGVFSVNTANNPFPSGNAMTFNISNITSDVKGYSFLAFEDIDGDGDQDGFISQMNKEIIEYKNTGTATNPILTLTIGSGNPLYSTYPLNKWQAIQFEDFNNDGIQDLILCTNYNANIHYNSGTNTAPDFNIGYSNPANYNYNTDAKPLFADIDGDGDKDLIFGNYFTGLIYYQNKGSISAPTYLYQTGTYNPFNNVTSYQYSAPAMTDIDGDGDQDLLLGSYTNLNYPAYFYLNFFLNTGTPTSPSYSIQSGSNSPFKALNVRNYSTSAPVFVDLDNDGDQDLVLSTGSWGLIYYPNTGTASAPVFTGNSTGNAVSTITSFDGNPAFQDLDNDGDFDLVLGNHSGVFYYQNTGSASVAAFTAETGTSNPFAVVTERGRFLVESYSPTFADLDGDGVPDLLVGNRDGTTTFYKNTGIAIPTSITHPVSSTFNEPLNAYPNPTKDVINLTLNDGIGSTMKIAVLDLSGRELQSQTTVNNGSPMNVNIGDLTNGLYMIQVTSDSKAGIVKVVKQ